MTRLLFLLPLLTLFGGCSWLRSNPVVSPPSFSSFNSPALQDVHRIAILPAWRGTGVGDATSAFDQAIGRSFRSLGAFEVVRGDAQLRDRHFPDPLGRGLVDPEALRAFRQATGVDAVLLARVDQFRSYDPVALGGTAHLVSCRDGQTLWSATGEWDGNTAAVQDDLRSWWWYNVGDANRRIAGWRTALSSPRLFARYVTDRMAASVDARG